MTASLHGPLTRRSLVVGSIGALALRGTVFAAPVLTDEPDYSYKFVDYWSAEEIEARENRLRLLSVGRSGDDDVRDAEGIISKAPTSSPLAIMEYFASLSTRGSTGEKFNSRWTKFENPVIVWFFHATGLTPTGDCTSWCAAFLSWSLERAGYKSARSARSKDYRSFGVEVKDPRSGDIVVFQDAASSDQGHVALYLAAGEGADAGKIKIIGGNQGHGADIPGCPKGFPVSQICEEMHSKVGAQFVQSYRRYI